MGMMFMKASTMAKRAVIFQKLCQDKYFSTIVTLVLGLAYLKKHNLSWPIYTDSVTAMAWVRQRKCKSKIVWGKQNEDLFYAVRKAEDWLRTHTWTNPVLKWETRLWGEIPADYGRKG